jgi:hypothetical protein
MDLVVVVLFLVLYYLRPQEWAGMFSTIHFVQLCMLTGLGTLFFRQGGLRLRDLFRTPHDWAVLAFWLWIVLTAPNRWETFKENANLYIFYIVIVQVLRSVPRMKIFVGWWTMLIVAVASLALASKWGFDPLESLDITNTQMKGRLILNLSIFNNPNGLGHSVVPAIPMLYYFFIWKRPIISRVLGAALLIIPLYCIYLTISKGAFLSAGITVFATMAIGRPKKVQVAMAAFAFVFGTGLMYSLPRMNELDKAKGDAAIQGRVAAFRHGYELMQTTNAGVGKGHWGDQNFMTDYIPVLIAAKPGQSDTKARRVMQPVHYNKAPHSSYVCTGAELGKPGLFLFLAVLYCCLRTTTSARTDMPDEERIRRMLFVLVVSYSVSSWMVDFEYRPTFFMFTAAIAALHRQLLGLLPEKEKEEEEAPSLVPVWKTADLLPEPALAGMPNAGGAARAILAQETELETAIATETPAPASRIALGWNRLGIFDLAAVLVLTYAAIRFWVYTMERM